MNISKVKEDILKYKGKLLHFRYNGARNQIEEFDGKIENIYNAIFTIKLEDNSNIKSAECRVILSFIILPAGIWCLRHFFNISGDEVLFLIFLQTKKDRSQPVLALLVIFYSFCLYRSDYLTYSK